VTKDEALALFERIYKHFSQISHSYTELKLYANIDQGQLGDREEEWSIVIGDWVIESEGQWEEHKRDQGIVEVPA
jgi:hypothetical protein